MGASPPDPLAIDISELSPMRHWKGPGRDHRHRNVRVQLRPELSDPCWVSRNLLWRKISRRWFVSKSRKKSVFWREKEKKRKDPIWSRTSTKLRNFLRNKILSDFFKGKHPFFKSPGSVFQGLEGCLTFRCCRIVYTVYLDLPFSPSLQGVVPSKQR